MGARLLLVLLVKHVNSRLTPDGTKGEMGKNCVVSFKSVDMVLDGFAFNEGPRFLLLFYFTPVREMCARGEYGKQ